MFLARLVAKLVMDVSVPEDKNGHCHLDKTEKLLGVKGHPCD